MSSTSGSISSSGGCEEVVAPRTTIVGLRNSGSLVPGCPYTANNITWVSAGGIGDFTAVATSIDSLSSTGYYESPTLNPGEPWEAEMDWDTGRVHFLKDATTRENTVWGDTEVQTFPWSTPTVTRTTVVHSVFSYSGGTVDNVVIEGNSNVRITTGTLRDSSFTSGARFSMTATSTIQDLVISSDGSLSVTGAGSTVTQVKLSAQSSLFIGATTNIQESSFDTRTTAYFQGGTHTSFDASNYSYVDARGWTGSFTRVALEGADLRISGTGSFSNSTLTGLGYIRAANVSNLFVTHLSFNGYGYISAANSIGFRLSYTSFDGMGYIYCDRSNNFRLDRSNLDQNGIISVNDARDLIMSRIRVSQSSSLTGTRGSGNLDYITLTEQSSLNVSDATRLNLDYLSITTSSQLDIRTSTNFQSREIDISSNGNVYFNNSTNCRLYYGVVKASSVFFRNCNNCRFDYPSIQAGYIYMDGSQSVNFTYVGMSTYGYIRGVNIPQGSITRVTLNGYGLIRLQGNIASGWGITNTTIDSQGDLRVESNGRIQRSHITSGAILTTRHNGTIDKAFVMQTTSTQTTPSTNLRLHSAGPF